MASTYSNTGIELITTGERANTWGDATNTNWQLMEESVSGVVSIALTGTTYSLTNSNGSSAEARHAVVAFTGSPGGTCTVTVGPNTMQKVYYVDNQSDQTVTMAQGSGNTVDVLADSRAIVYCDGAGSGAAVTEILGSNASVFADLTPTEDVFIVGDGSTWITTTPAEIKATLDLEIGTDVQAWDDDLDDIAALTPTDGAVIIGDGTNWTTSTGLADFEGLSPDSDRWIIGNGSNWVTTTGAVNLQAWSAKTVPTGTVVGTTDAQTLTNKTFVDWTETVYALSGTSPVFSVDNGTVQTWTLTGNSVPTESLSSGQSMTLMVMDGTGYTIDWSSSVDLWIGGASPSLSPTYYTVIELWKVGSSLYGALVGIAQPDAS